MHTTHLTPHQQSFVSTFWLHNIDRLYRESTFKIAYECHDGLVNTLREEEQ